LENLESEISILTAIRHDNIVGLIECQVIDIPKKKKKPSKNYA
jgi:hypothetical protein